MNICKKIALGLALIAGMHATAAQLTFDAFIKGAANKDMVFRALGEVVKKYPKLVIYFGKKACKYCVKTEQSIAALLAQYPDVMFVMIDLAKYPFFANGAVFKKSNTVPKVRFLLNGIEITITDSLTVAELKALLDQYYR